MDPVTGLPPAVSPSTPVTPGAAAPTQEISSADMDQLLAIVGQSVFPFILDEMREALREDQ